MLGGFVYILTDHKRRVLYTGVTSDLPTRLNEHTQGRSEFTSKYGLNILVYYEAHDEIFEAIHREKQVKRWRRAWKEELIQNANPLWSDLSATLLR
jgi:putative endonuclease